MKFSTKLRGRNSPHIFTRGNKSTVVSKAAAHFNSEPVKGMISNEAAVVKEEVEEVPVKEEEKIVDAFPNIHVDARQDDDDDSVSIQTEQREDIQSLASIKTECEDPDEEVREETSDAAVETQADADAEKAGESSDAEASEEQVEFTTPVADGCRASCSMGPHIEKSLAIMKECRQSVSHRFEEARPGLEQRASDMKTSIAGASAKAGTTLVAAGTVAGASLAAGAVVVGTKAGQSIVNVSTRAGGMAQRFVCGDERALQYHAETQEQVASPKTEVTSHIDVTGVKSPTQSVLNKYTLNRLVCGGYKSADCLHDMAVGAVDILCLGYCDCNKTDSNDDLSAPFSPGTIGDSTTRAFTFDTLDSCGDYTQATDPSLTMNLSLAKAALIAESRAIMLQSVELTEGDFKRTIVSSANAATPMVRNGNGKNFFSTKASRGRRSPFSPSAGAVKMSSNSRASPVPGMRINSNASDAENVAIELVGEALTPKPKTARKSFFRKKGSDYKIQAIVEDRKGSSITSESQKTGSTGGSTAQVNNTKSMVLFLKRTERSKSNSSDDTNKDSKARDGQESMYSL